MKKILALFITCFLLCFIIATPVLAAEGKISATTTEIDKAKNQFTVELNIDNNPGVIAVQPRIEYDSSALKLVSTANGEIFEGIYTKSQYQSAVPYDMIFMDATADENTTKTGLLATYTFEVISNVNETEIKLSIKDVSVHGLTKDNKPSFNNCNVKVNLNKVSTLPAQQNTTTNKDSIQSNTTPNEQTNQIEEQPQTQPNTAEDDLNTKTTILIVSLIVVLVLGVIITAVAIIIKKKKQ